MPGDALGANGKLDVAAWLSSLGLARYTGLFAQNALEEDVLLALTEDHLKELGLPMGDRIRLRKAIDQLKDSTAKRGEAATAVPEFVPADAAASDAPVSLEGTSLRAERRHLTVLFCDLVGSTSISARLDPEDMRDLLQAYKNTVTDVITRFEGEVRGFEGDGAMACFGLRRAQEHAAELAVRAALLLVERVKEIKTPFTAPPLAVRVGIASGPVVVEGGTVVGAPLNLASRLQNSAGPQEVVVAASTRRLIGDMFTLADMGLCDVKGIVQPVRAWKVLRESAAEGHVETLQAQMLAPIVGREEELDLLLRRWESAKAGSGQVVMLGGEPGIGKSRLAAALLERLHDEPKRDVRLFCSRNHANSALYPIIEFFQRAADWQPEDATGVKLEKLEAFVSASGCNLVETMPFIAAMMALPTGDKYPTPDLHLRMLKNRTLAAVAGIVECLSIESPILMIVEDAVWLDPTSNELFDWIIDRIPSSRILLVVTFRPEFRAPWAGPAHITVLTLNRLGQREGTEIIRRVAAAKTLPLEVVQRILSKTDGIPLFIEELTRTVLETGLVTDVGDHYELGEPLSEFAIPDSLQDSLMARLDRLAAAREVAQIAACIGREFDYTLLAAVAAPITSRDLESALNSLVASELMLAHGVVPDATYKFKHALVHDAAYQTLLKSMRVVYHQRIARALEEMFPDVAASEPEVVAHHYTRARVPEKSIEFWMRAAEKAMAGSGTLEAVEYFSRALKQIGELQPTPARDERELEILIALAVPLTAAKGYASRQLEQTYKRARELCDALREESKLFPVVYGLWRFYLLRADYQAAHNLAMQLAEMADQSDDQVFEIAAHRAMGATLFYMGKLDESREQLRHVIETPATEEARARLLKFDVIDPWVASHAYSGWTNWLLGYPDRARQISDQTIALAEEIGHKFSIALAKCFAAWTYQFCGDRERTAAIARQALQFTKENEFHFWVGWAEILLAWASSGSNEPDKKLDEIRAGLADWRATESRLGLSYFLCLVSDAIGTDPSVEAHISIREAAEFAAQTGERWWTPEIERIQGELFRAQPDAEPGAAVACFLRAIENAKSMNAKSLELRSALGLARLYASQQRYSEARATLVEIFSSFTEGFDTEDLRQAKELLERLSVI